MSNIRYLVYVLCVGGVKCVCIESSIQGILICIQHSCQKIGNEINFRLDLVGRSPQFIDNWSSFIMLL